MAYKIDVLICYAESDNSANENEKGWVSNFKYFLELMLEQVMGEKPNILLKSDENNLTAADLTDAAILIPVISPQFIESGKCLDILEDFGKQAENTKVPRIFKVLKYPVAVDLQPTRLQPKIGYDLYKIDEETGSAEDYSDYFGIEATSSYWMHIVDIAFDIHESLFQLSGKPGSSKKITSRKTVYIAETAHDLITQRNTIKRELQRHGYKILPDQSLPNDAAKLDKKVRGYIEKSDISIHLIGSSYGDLPQGSDKSIVDLQNSIAAEKAHSNNEFQRYIWITPYLRTASEKQKTFIENVKRDSDGFEGAEILQTPLEDFKNMLRSDIIDGGMQKRVLSHSELSNSGSSPLVYLIHDKIDSKKVTPLKKELENQGFEVITPKFDGELMTIRENHINNLRNFDGAIVFQGDVNRQWVRMKILDLLKAPGFGRNKPMKGRALVSNDSVGFENYEKQGISMFENDNNLSKNLESFIKDVKEN